MEHDCRHRFLPAASALAALASSALAIPAAAAADTRSYDVGLLAAVTLPGVGGDDLSAPVEGALFGVDFGYGSPVFKFHFLGATSMLGFDADFSGPKIAFGGALTHRWGRRPDEARHETVFGWRVVQLEYLSAREHVSERYATQTVFFGGTGFWGRQDLRIADTRVFVGLALIADLRVLSVQDAGMKTGAGFSGGIALTISLKPKQDESLL